MNSTHTPTTRRATAQAISDQLNADPLLMEEVSAITEQLSRTPLTSSAVIDELEDLRDECKTLEANALSHGDRSAYDRMEEQRDEMQEKLDQIREITNN